MTVNKGNLGLRVDWRSIRRRWIRGIGIKVVRKTVMEMPGGRKLIRLRRILGGGEKRLSRVETRIRGLLLRECLTILVRELGLEELGEGLCRHRRRVFLLIGSQLDSILQGRLLSIWSRQSRIMQRHNLRC